MAPVRVRKPPRIGPRAGPGRDTRRSAVLSREARRLLPGGVSSPVRAYEPYPRFMARGHGPYLEDVDGNRYVDLCLAFGPLLLGHAHPAVREAIRDRASRGTLFGTPVEEEILLARMLARHHPSMERVRFVSTGGEAVSSILRLARAHTGRPAVVKMDGGFHGSLDQLLVQAGSGAAAQPSSAGVLPNPATPTYVVPYNNPDALSECLSMHPDVGLVLLEPVLGNMGLILPRKGYLREVARLTRAAGALLAFDEIITGYRLGLGGAEAFYGVRPDLLALGKVLGGGLPLAAYGGRKEILQRVAPEGPVYQAGTYSGNPLSLAAGSATLRVLEKEGTSRADSAATAIVKGMREELERRGIPGQVSHLANMFSLFFSATPVEDAECARRAAREPFQVLSRRLLERGVYLAQSPFETSFLSTAHGDRECEIVVDAFRDALRDLPQGR